MQRLTVIKAITDQDQPRSDPVILTYGEDPLGFVRIAIVAPVDYPDGGSGYVSATAAISVKDLLSFTRLVALDQKKV